MLIDNIIFSDRLINGSSNTIKHIDKHFVVQRGKLDDPKAGNSLRDRRLCGELKKYVPITTRAKRFPLKNTDMAERNNFR